MNTPPSRNADRFTPFKIFRRLGALRRRVVPGQTAAIGSGLQQVLFLIANIVYNSYKIIGVEEIELNLSPEAQKRVFETLKSLVYKTKLINQVLVTSHSPYFRNRKDVKYFQVTYDERSLSTVVTPAAKAVEAKFFDLSG